MHIGNASNWIGSQAHTPERQRKAFILTESAFQTLRNTIICLLRDSATGKALHTLYFQMELEIAGNVKQFCSIWSEGTPLSMRFLVTLLHYFIAEGDNLFDNTQHYLQFIAGAQLSHSPVQFLIFSYGDSQIILLRNQRGIQRFWTWYTVLLCINSGLITYCIVIFIHWYQVLLIYYIQWLYVILTILTAINGCFVIWMFWIIARKMTKVYAIIETRGFLVGLNDKFL